MNKTYWCQPVDIIAVIVLVGGFALLLRGGCNGTCSELLIAVAAFYFGLKSNLPPTPNLTGKQGATGPTGAQGEQGEQGATGNKGSNC